MLAAGLSVLIAGLCSMAGTRSRSQVRAWERRGCVQLDSSWATPAKDRMIITGTVTNYCESDSGPVAIRFKLLRAGREVGQARATVMRVRAGESWHFEASGPPADSHGFAQFN